MLPNDLGALAGEIENASRAFVLAQIGVTLIMAVSLKQLWNFMNVV